MWSLLLLLAAVSNHALCSRSSFYAAVPSSRVQAEEAKPQTANHREAMTAVGQAEYEHAESPHWADREFGIDVAIVSGGMSGQRDGKSLKKLVSELTLIKPKQRR